MNVAITPEAMPAHSSHGPSGADTWSNCPGSIAAQAGIPDTDNKHSIRGTAAHQLLEWVVTGQIPKMPTKGIYDVDVELVDGSTTTVSLNQEDFKAVQVAVDFTNDQRTPDCQFAAEHQTDPGPACQGSDMWGTMDLRFYYPQAQYLHVADYKHGRGPVDVEGNRQTILYAIGEADALIRAGHPVQTVRLTIIQPRRSDGAAAISSVEMDINDLWEWVPFFADARKATDHPEAPRIPGEKQCKWCKAVACPEAARSNINAISQVNQLVDSPVAHMPENPDMLTPAQLVVVASHLKQFRDWADRVEAYMLEQSQAGTVYEDPDGNFWGPVDKQTKRRWKFSTEDTMKKISNKLKTVNKNLPKEDKLGIDTYRGHKLLSFTEVLDRIAQSTLSDEAKSALQTAISEELIEKPTPGKKLGILAEPPFTFLESTTAPVAELPDFLG